MTTTARRSSAAVLVLMALAGCTTTTSGGAQPSSAPNTSSAADPGVPKITSPPLDLTAAKANPCSLVPAQLQDQYGLKGPGEANASGVTGPNCTFLRKTSADPVAIVGVNTKSDGLAGLYARRSSFVVFEESTISSYPALYLQPVKDNGGCSVVAAVNDAELISVDVRLPNTDTAKPGDACAIATPLLQSAVSGLPK